MGKLAVIEIVDGDFDHGFSVIIRIGEEGRNLFCDARGNLPPNPDILNLYRDWQKSYKFHQADCIQRKLDPIKERPSNVSTSDVKAKMDLLKNKINEWLNCSEFRQARELLKQELKQSEQIRVIVRTNKNELYQLPWHLWDVFNHYINADVVFCPTVNNFSIPEWRLSNSPDKIKVLAVFGRQDSKDCLEPNTQKDRELLRKHLSDVADLRDIVMTTARDLCALLRTEKAEIFYYAGHSSSEPDGNGSEIDGMRISTTMNAFKEAADNGLKLAIFNSCQGLAIANQLLTESHIPLVVVMREPIQDEVAHEFLKYFIQEFTKGEPLHLALRKARERLHDLEEEHPGASWLPVIFQHSTEVPSNWNLQPTPSENKNQSQEILDASTKTEPDQPSNQSWIKRYFGKICIGAAGLIILGGIMGVMALRNQATLDQIAKNNTVSIKGKNQGSGVIFANQGNIFYVLTAKSVVNPKDQYKIVTVDREEYPAKISQKLSGIDFVILQFNSAKNYSIARLANSDTAREGTAVFLSGWSQIDGSEEPSYHFIEGEIASLPRALRNGYTLIYDSNSREGMIGGPLIDAHGCVIGIHARPETEALRNLESAQIGLVKNGFNQGIPLRHILEKISEPELENDLGRVDKDCR